MLKQAIFGVLAAVSLTLPGISTAQSSNDQGYGSYGGQNQGYGSYGGQDQGYGSHGYRNGDDAQPRGDYQSGDGDYGWRRRFSGYPEFRGVEAHIRSEVIQNLRDDMIDQDGAQDLLDQLRRVRMDENREFQHHGWRLPDDDRYRIRSELDRLDREVDRVREEPEG